MQQLSWALSHLVDHALGAIVGVLLLLHASWLSTALLQATGSGLQQLAEVTRWLMGAPAGQPSLSCATE